MPVATAARQQVKNLLDEALVLRPQSFFTLTEIVTARWLLVFAALGRSSLRGGIPTVTTDSGGYYHTVPPSE